MKIAIQPLTELVSDNSLYKKRDFHLILSPSTSLFTKSFTPTHNNGTSDPVDLSFIYDGTVKGEPGSDVHGSVIWGIFRGTVRIPGDTVYHIEPAYRFYGLKEAQRLPYHSVIYKEEHIDVHPLRNKRNADFETTRCALDKYHDWMKHQTEAEVDIRNKRAYFSYKDTTRQNPIESDKVESRGRRQLHRCFYYMGSRNTCILYLRSDPTLYNKFKEDLDNNEMAARDEILSFFASHVSALNRIYGRAEFRPFNETSPCYQGIQFQIQRTTIMTNETEACSDPLKKTAFCQPNLSIATFLDLTSLTNHDAFCLSFTFTYQDFAKGTMGLSWISTPTGSGGICAKYKAYVNTDKHIWKSLNTGVVSIVNYNQRVPPRVSELTFAHEVGHSFGSPHDNSDKCNQYGINIPSSDAGNYLMFGSSTPGNLPINDKFSNCSADKITKVIDAVVNQLNGKVNCFKESGMAFCGNGIVENGEECDCGYEEDCTDLCCNPKRTGEPTNNISCTRKTNPNTNTKYECSASCPESEKKADLEYCNNYSAVCQQGECAGSLCLKVGKTPDEWEECSLTMSGHLTVQQREQLCYLSCKKKNDIDSRCYATYDNLDSSNPLYSLLQEVNGLGKSSGGIKLAPGTPCNNFKGYCDAFSRCRIADNGTPLQDLNDLLFSEKGLENIKTWIFENWWSVLLMVFGLILVIGLEIIVCRKRKQSSKFNAKPI